MALQTQGLLSPEPPLPAEPLWMALGERGFLQVI